MSPTETTHHLESDSEWASILNSNNLIVVKCGATWCGPCRVIQPAFDALAAKHLHVKFVSVDADECPEFCNNHGVTALPTFLSFVAGNKFGEVRGANKANLETLVAEVSVQVGNSETSEGAAVVSTSSPSLSVSDKDASTSPSSSVNETIPNAAINTTNEDVEVQPSTSTTDESVV